MRPQHPWYGVWSKPDLVALLDKAFGKKLTEGSEPNNAYAQRRLRSQSGSGFGLKVEGHRSI